MRKAIISLALTLTMMSCKQTEDLTEEGLKFYFENPQPINDSELSKIPSKFVGDYVNNDSVHFEIREKLILLVYNNWVVFQRNELDSLKKEGIVYSGGNFLTNNGDIYPVKNYGDSIAIHSVSYDTVFKFKKNQKAKRINGKLILSYKDSIYWRVKCISLDKGILSVMHFASYEDIRKLDSITNIKSQTIDSSLYIFKPSRSEFKRILKTKNLGYVRQYKKIT